MVQSKSNHKDIGYGREGLAPYACKAANSRGRYVEEPESPTRTPFQRDRDRIIHSTTFRRLKHKTQVFVYHEGDHYRTRLTHSIEVAQIARALARALRVDEDLAETLALAHDFGHTPFGHAGEDVLDDMMRDYGGFDHNAQSLRCVTKLERQYAQFDGLNLSWEALEGLVKHNGPIIGENIPYAIAQFNALYDLDLEQYSTIEAQCAAIADDIAYNAHDLDDGLRAGMFKIDDLASLPLAGDTLKRVRKQYPSLEDKRVVHEIVRAQITAMVEDVINQSVSAISILNPQSDSDVRMAGRALVSFSPEMAKTEAAIKAFLYKHMYRAPSVMAIRKNAQQILRELFAAYFSGDAEMPNEWGLNWSEASARMDDRKRARLVSDFLSGMTDKFAIDEHQRLFDVTPELR